MIILKKLHIAPDKLHECSTITEVISHCVYCRNFFQLFPSRGCWAWKFVPRLKRNPGL